MGGGGAGVKKIGFVGKNFSKKGGAAPYFYIYDNFLCDTSLITKI